jgi:hypothetical protein
MIKINNAEWEPNSLYLRQPNEDFVLRIDNRNVENAQRNIQIRNLKIVENF